MPTQLHPSIAHAPAWENGGHYDPPQADSGERMESITELVREVQIGALLITLDKQLISREKEFETEISKLTKLLFPRHFDMPLIERRFRLLGQTLSVHGKASEFAERHRVPISDEELDRYIANKPLGQLGAHLRGRFSSNPNLDKATKCGDILHSHGSDYDHEEQKKVQEILRQAARANLGIPSKIQKLDGDDRYFLGDTMSRSNAQVLQELASEDFLPKYDRIIIGAAMQENEKVPYLATEQANVITLYPSFLGLMNTFQRDVKAVFISSLTVDKLVPRTLQTLFHEYFHAEALGDTTDVKILNSVLCAALQIEILNKEYDPNKLTVCNTFGTNMFISALDNRDGGNRAEDNADSWGRFAQFYLAIVAYPEYDFLSAPTLRRRKTLLHHCSLLDCLRIKCTGPVRNLPGYCASKDPFSAGDASYQPPENSSKLLEKMLELTNKDKRARSLKEILKELDVRTEDDPVRKVNESHEGELKLKELGNDAGERHKQDTSSTFMSSEALHLDDLQRNVLLAEFKAGLMIMEATEGLWA